MKPREGTPAPTVRAEPKQELPVKQLNKQTIYHEGKPKVVLLHDRKSTLENLDKLLRKLTDWL